MWKENPELLGRMLEAGRLKNLTELARALSLTPQAISNYKKRGSLPPSLIFKFAEQYDMSIDWLLKGTGKPSRSAGPASTVCMISMVEKASATGPAPQGLEPAGAALSPEELIYIGKLLTILRRHDSVTSPVVKTSIDVFFQVG